jgi:plastocyanin
MRALIICLSLLALLAAAGLLLARPEAAGGPDRARAAERPAERTYADQEGEDDEAPEVYEEKEEGYEQDEERHDRPESDEPVEPDEDEADVSGPEGKYSGEMRGYERVVEIAAQNYEFEPDRIVVREGETVRLRVTATDETHNFSLPAYEIDEDLDHNEIVEIVFEAGLAGTFTYFCGRHDSPGFPDMEGNLVVVEADVPVPPEGEEPIRRQPAGDQEAEEDERIGGGY